MTTDPREGGSRATMPPMFSEQQIRDRHRQSMKAIGEWRDSDYDRGHEDDVTAQVLAFQRGERERPYTHPHAESERGYCTECDAAGVLFWLEDEAEDSGG